MNGNTKFNVVRLISVVDLYDMRYRYVNAIDCIHFPILHTTFNTRSPIRELIRQEEQNTK